MPQLNPPYDSPEDQAFRVLIWTLTKSPLLAGRNVTWAYWTGQADDRSTIESPTQAECPFVRLTIVGGGRAERQGSDGIFTSYRIPIVVEVATMVATTNRSEALALSNLIYGSIWPNPYGIDPGDPRYTATLDRRRDIDDRFRSVGVSDVMLRTPIMPSDYYGLFIASEGEVELIQFINL